MGVNIENVRALHITLVITGIIGILPGIAIFFIKCKFKGLRTPTTYLILNLLFWAMINCSVRLDIFYLYIIVFENSAKIKYDIFCGGISEVEQLCAIQIFLFCMLLAYDSYVLACSQELAKRLHENVEIVIICTNILGVLLSSSLSFLPSYGCLIKNHALLAFYLATMLFIFVAICLQGYKQPRYISGVALVCVSLYAPTTLLILILQIKKVFVNKDVNVHLNAGLLFITEFLKGCIPLGVAFVLIFCNRLDRLAVRKVFRGNTSLAEEQELNNDQNYNCFQETTNLNNQSED